MDLPVWRRWLSGENRVAAAVVAFFALVWTAAVIKLQAVFVLGISNALGLVTLLGEAGWALYATLLLFGVMVLPALLFPWIAGSSLRFGRATGVGVGIAVGLFGFVVAFGIAALGAVTSLQPAPLAILPFLLGIVAIFIQSAAEEVVFRGWIQTLLVRHIGPWGGIAVAAVAFGLLHILAGADTIISIVNICLAGAVFGLLAWRTGGLFAPIAAHFAWNWAETVLFGLSPNPGVDVWGAVWNFDLSGSSLWSGGGEGMNASLAETFVLLALCVPLALWRSRMPEPQPANLRAYTNGDSL